MADLSQIPTDQLMQMLQQHPAVTGQAAPQTIQPSSLERPFIGFNKGLANTVGAPVDALNWLGSHDPVTMGVNAVGHLAGAKDDLLPDMSSKLQIKNPVMGSEWIKKNLLGPIGANPDTRAPAATPGQRILENVGAGATAILGPGSLGANLATGAAAGLGSGVAQELVPDKYKPIAGTLGALATGTGAALLPSGVRAAANAVRNVTTPMRAAFSNVDLAQGPAVYDTTAAKGAASVLANRASDIDAVKSSLSGGADELVPGSRPTTFQQTGDMGLGSLEREMATMYPAEFKANEASQNIARTQALQGIQQGGAPADLTSFFNSQFRDLDAQTAQHIDQLHGQALQHAQNLGGFGTPEVYGENLRGILQEAENGARARESGLWNAIDPKGDLTGNVQQTVQAAKEIPASLGKTAKPMQGEEAAIFDAAKTLTPISPVSDLIDLRSRVSTEMRNELIANGRSPSYARLAQLRGAIQNNLSDSIGNQVSNEAKAVDAGAMASEDTVLARIKGWQDDYYAQKAAAQPNLGASAGNGTASPNSVSGTAFPASGGFGSDASDSGLPGNSPTFDQPARERLTSATDATKARARTYGVPPVGQSLAKAGSQDLYKLPEAKVPGKFFHPGPTGFSDMQSLYNAVGEDKAVPLIQDYAASSLRKAAMNDDGTLDPVAFGKWKDAHQDSLRALPDSVRGQYADASRATQAVMDVTELREQALKAAQSDALGKIMGASHPDDVTRAIGSVFGSKDRVAQMGTIAHAASKDPFAQQGLRQAVVDHITNKFISSREAGASGVNEIQVNAFQSFLKQNRAALAQVLEPDEMQRMQAIANDLQRSNRSINATKLKGGSNTAQDAFSVQKNHPVTTSVLRLLVDSPGAFVGWHVAGPVGAFIGGVGTHALQAMRETGINNINSLVNKAILNPDVANALLAKVPARQNLGSAKTLSSALRRAVLAASIQSVANRNTVGASP